ncbi:MAG: dimethylsulfide dehydrogenase [Chloroflexi bacterium]|nr:MAG: dimethylsulfide dehydrogenase [Chloroflexota bacterium]
MSADEIKIVRTTTWSAGPGCHGGCGVLAYIKDGKLVKVEGDPDHPWNQGRLCPRALALTQYVYHPDRLRYPLKRVGRRGEGKWERLSWDEAFDLIEKRLKEIKQHYGPESVIFLQGTGRDIGGWISMLAYAYGSPNWVFGLSGLACYTPRLMVMWITHGDHCVVDAAQWLPQRYDDPDYRLPQCILVWGQNLPATCPDAFFGHWIVDLMKRGSELIVVDPRFTWLASRAKIWLQIRPGTDGALALGFLNVILNEKLYDEEFVERWTNAPFLVRVDKEEKLLRESDLKPGGGENNFVVWDTAANQPAIWDSAQAQYTSPDVKPALEGTFRIGLANGEAAECQTVWIRLKERVSQYTPERVSEITWAPPEKIVEAARFYARSKPAAIHWGLPIDTIPSTTPTAQAIAHLWSLTGNLDVPGGNVIARYPFDVVTYPYHSGVGILSLPPEVHQKRIGTWKYGPVKDFRAWAHPDMMLEQVFTEDPYPIKGMWIQTANPLACTGLEPQKWYKALKKLDFVVVVDLFLTPTAMLADVVLPAATFLEKNSLKGWWVPLQAIRKVINVEECKSDIEINFELARRFKPDFPWESIEEMFDQLLRPSGMTYKELCEKGWVLPPKGHPTAPYLRYEKGLLRRDGKPGFLTPSGKLELYSSWLERWGLEPLPYYEEPPFSPVSTPELYREYPLILTTGRRSSVFFHSEHRMIPWLREQDPDPIIEIHPQTAQSLGLEDGDLVWVENWLGKCKRKAKVTPTIHPKVVMAPHGWWLPEREGSEPSLFGVWEVNINQLIPMGKVGKSGYGCPLKSILCKVYKAGGE